jgi:hypothetical protein
LWQNKKTNSNCHSFVAKIFFSAKLPQLSFIQKYANLRFVFLLFYENPNKTVKNNLKNTYIWVLFAFVI